MSAESTSGSEAGSMSGVEALPRPGSVPGSVQAPGPAPRIVVVGGVAGGMSFAARARRLAEHARITVLEKDPYVSFANCGLPYHLGGEIPERSKLILHTPESLAAALALDVRTGHEVVGVDRAAHSVRVREVASGREYDEAYDTLVLATGAAPLVPPLPGVDLPQVRVLRSIPDVDALQELVDAGARRAVVVGAGFIGLEVAEALVHRGLAVSVVELSDQVLPPLDPELARAVEQALTRGGVDVRTSVSLTAIRAAGPDEGGAVVASLSDGDELGADLVLLAVGVRPESSLARAAGLALGPRGHVLVDDTLRTSDPDIYAVGDAIEVVDAVSGAATAVPLAGPANRQGRAAADHLFGRRGRRTPVLGTAIVRVFDVVAATTGKNEKTLRAAGVAHHVVHVHPAHHAGYYPGARAMHLKLMFAPDGKVLGAQATGGDGVDKRIDVIATAIRAGMSVHDLADLELCYAPPFGSAKDPVNQAGFVAQNVLAGDTVLWYAHDAPDSQAPETDALALTEAEPGTPGAQEPAPACSDTADPAPGVVLLDVRSEKEFTAGHLSGALNIPHTELRERLDEVRDALTRAGALSAASAPTPPGRRPALLVYCASGFRSYLALRILHQQGLPGSATLSGGLSTLRLIRPDLPLPTGPTPQPTHT